MHGVILSQVRYCISAYSSVKLKETDTRSGGLDKIQVLMNNVARIVNQVKRTDHVSINELFKMSPWLSLNHMSANSIVVDTWRALRDPSVMNYYNTDYNCNTRAASQELVKVNDICCSPFIKNGTMLLNHPVFKNVKYLTDIKQVKKHVKQELQKLPL